MPYDILVYYTIVFVRSVEKCANAPSPLLKGRRMFMFLKGRVNIVVGKG
jgi:hypothetical protein